jgi:AraC-like DNA-binding protein
MDTVTIVGDYFSTASPQAATGVRFINHVTNSNVIRNKIIVQSYLFSLLVEGAKAVHTAHTSVAINNDKFLLILPGNYLMTEKIASAEGRFQSILVFFNQQALNTFFSKYEDIITKMANNSTDQVQIFTKDEFLKSFISSVLLLSGTENEIPAAMQQLKLEELLLYLCYQYGGKMSQLKHLGKTEMEIKKLAESNIGTNITLDELAFLCNLSVSTFKRRFMQLYGIAPSKWFLQRRMELATTLLKTGKETPSEIYYKVGYESHSSFTHSFKQVFGITPTQYREHMV